MLMITVDRPIDTKDTGSIIRMNGIGVCSQIDCLQMYVQVADVGWLMCLCPLQNAAVRRQKL